MDDQRPEAVEETEPAPPKPAPPAELFQVPPSTGREAWRGGSGCGPRTRVYLFGLAAVILIAVLFAGLSVLRRGVWASLEQGRTAVVRSLPPDLPAGERERTMRNLERFRSLLDRVDDPYPLMGELMTRVRAAFEDGRLEKHEVEELNLFLEQTIEESGVPPMQLGIRNLEFGIRNAALPPPSTNRPSDRCLSSGESIQVCAPDQRCRLAGGGVVGNSEFRIPNSEFV